MRDAHMVQQSLVLDGEWSIAHVPAPECMVGNRMNRRKALSLFGAPVAAASLMLPTVGEGPKAGLVTSKTPGHQHIVVEFNGVRLWRDCVEADDIRGYVKVRVRDANGKRTPLIETRYGDVRIVPLDYVFDEYDDIDAPSHDGAA